MGKFKEALYTNTEKFANKYGDIFISLYCYEYNNEYKKPCDLPEELDQTVIDTIIFLLDHYFNSILEDDKEININLIDTEMLFDLLELYDY
jgi:hypothetical protein